MKLETQSQSLSADRITPRVAIIGGGLGGICAGIQLQKQLGITNYTIFDENEDFGGTWLVNKYPGAACDIESALYSFSFELNPNWSQNFTKQSEIHEYIVNVAKKYDLYKHAQFLTLVKSLKWQETEGKWELVAFDKQTQKTSISYFDYTIWAVGALRAPLVPSEFDGFKGQIIHSAEWNSNLDLSGKRVGVIGSGASAIQIIPTIAPHVKELHSYQRTPSWVITRPQFDVPNFVKAIFNAVPFFMWLYRFIIFAVHELTFCAFQTDSLLNYFVTINTKYYLKRQVSNQDTQNKLLPDYKLGCKRVLLSENYYRTFNLSHVHLHREKLGEIQGNKIRLAGGGSTQELDVLILATGFRVQDFFAPLQVTGRGKMDLLPQWKKDGPQSYFGIMSSEAPNSFMILGPNTVLGHNSCIFMIECQCDFIMQVIREAMERRAKTVAVRKDAEENWMKTMKGDMKSTIWQSGGCNAWYSDARGVVTALWPKTCLAYFRETKNVNFTDMQWTF